MLGVVGKGSPSSPGKKKKKKKKKSKLAFEVPGLERDHVALVCLPDHRGVLLSMARFTA